MNPADEATRSVSANNMQESMWLNGPKYLCDVIADEEYPLINPDSDQEVRVLKTDIPNNSKPCQLGTRFEHFSSWYGLVRAISNLKHVVARRTDKNGNPGCCKDRHLCHIGKTPEALKESEVFILKVVQQDCFQQELDALKSGGALSRNSAIRNLDPFLDADGLLRVGGRLRNSELTSQERNPIIIPKRHHVASLLISHYHQEVKHQGRMFTEGAIRSAGYWIIGSRRLVNSYLGKCVKCLRLRGKRQVQKMSDLPCDRLKPAPPFSYIGIDVFGPWTVVTRKTRGGQAESKRWAVLFTCLVIRAVHIEVIQEMTSSCFINALRRFVSLRGEVKLIRSDCGSNFVGAAKDIRANIINIEDPVTKAFLSTNKISWKFNPPHASHMGGSWERIIGISRKILDSLLKDVPHRNLTHEVLTTLMAEVCSIINARPLTGIPSDPDTPMPLTPSTLLTMKTSHVANSFCIEEFTPKDLYKSQWRCVQQLANSFWKRWKNEYLSSLQSRQKWQDDSRNVIEGDIVLVRDKSLCRNDWPMAVVSKAIPSADGRIRKVEVRVDNGKLYLRPVSEVVVLVPKQ
ncbi:uncharacterized protein [Argopecten irradians]|uniref:uncharacterized protein n=1 Tax=Argopecten irradians TaxID=31199 RepID=UPI00371D32C1